MSKLMGRSLMTFLIVAFAVGGAGNLFASEVKNAKDKVKVSVYGQVNKAFMSVNDGNETYNNFVDNDLSSTRFGFKAKAKGDAMTAGANMEWEYQSNSSDKVTQAATNLADALAKRKLEVYLDTSVGKFSLGHGGTASDGTSEVDISGSSAASYSGVAWAKSFLFFDENANALSGTDIGDVASNLDGNSRKDRFRYDTPKFGGFKISASVFQEAIIKTGAAAPTTYDSAYDLALRYGGKMGDALKLKAAVAYSKYPNTDAADKKDTLFNGSLSVLFSGFSVTGAFGQQDLQNVTAGKADSESTWYGKLGYMSEFTSAGKTAFAVDYGNYDEFSGIKNDTANTYGIYAVQHLKAYSSELYGGYRIYTLDDRVSTGEKFKDINVLFLGMRIKF